MVDVLLTDDEATIRLVMGDALRAAGHTVTLASDGQQALSLLEIREFSVAVLDLRLPRVSGLTLFRRLREIRPSTDVILMTAHGAVREAIDAIRDGAQDYLLKPFEPETLIAAVKRLTEQHRLRNELEQARRALASFGLRERLIGSSAVMVKMYERIDAIAQSDASVLICGESGTGKEQVARAIHERSPRRDGPFLAVNCAALPEALLEAELFGHERGAFTGAFRKRDGRFREADGGTLVLDEIGDLPLSAQVKLLRVLQEGCFEPVGSNTSIRSDCRILSITNRNLKTLVAEGRFREDLFYRIRVLEVQVPPLRERVGDLPILVEHFLRRFTPQGLEPPDLTPRTWAALRSYPFPGNVRELMHAVEHAVVLSGGREVDLEHLPDDIGGRGEPVQVTGRIRPLAEVVREFEREYLRRALRQEGGRRSQVAERLGISRKNLWEKLKAHGLSDEPHEPGELEPP